MSTDEADEHVHDWKVIVERVPEQKRSERQIEMGMAYKGGRVYFKKKVCSGCKQEMLLDYKMEALHTGKEG